VRLVLEMLREGIDRITIWQNMAKHAKIPISTIDNYISEAKQLLEMEQAKIDEAVTADRISRALEASKKIPTNEELIATLARKIDLSKPDITGYELKIINGEANNVQRFASETFYLTAISKIIDYNNKLEITQIPEDNETVKNLTDEQLTKIAQIINGNGDT
jgi:hypothetical protein